MPPVAPSDGASNIVFKRVLDLENVSSTVLKTMNIAGNQAVITVISDLHIGVPGDRANDFQISDDVFVSWMKERLQKSAALILLGDVLEMWEIKTATTTPKQRLARLKTARPKLFKFFDEHLNNDVFYVLGNHDASTGKLMNNILGLELEFPSGATIFATHGHFVDEDNSGSGEWKGRIGAAFRGALERELDDDVDIILMKLADQVGRSGDAKLYSDWGARLVEAYNYDLVLMGHTHKMETIKLPNNSYYANTGNGEDTVREGKLQVTTITVPLSGEKAGPKLSLSQDTIKLEKGRSICGGCQIL